MAENKSNPAITIRDLRSLDDLKQVGVVEREVWGLSELDALPLTFSMASLAAGSLWLGAFDGAKLVGFAFGFLGTEQGQLLLHSHMLAVREPYRVFNLGYKLKLAQRERALAMRIGGLRIDEITWTFDPLQSRNAHLNFAKLGVISDSYKIDFYGAETSSVLHRNGTDRLWVRWAIASRRVQNRVQGKHNRSEMLDALATVEPLIRFNGNGRPARSDLGAALARQRVAIEIPSEIAEIERKDSALGHLWRVDTRWAFSEALKAGFVVEEFCRTIRGQQGPGAYLLQKGSIADFVPEIVRRP